MNKKNIKLKGTTRRSSLSPLLSAIVTPNPEPNISFTENGAVSLRTTESAVLDWFSSGGAMRNEADTKVHSVFAKAFAEDKLLATKVAFYIRDVRGGQGQRKTFRSVLQYLAANYPSVVRKNLHLIPVYGRWDDLLVLLNTQVERDVVTLIRQQLEADAKAMHKKENISLLGKWLPSQNTSSGETVALANHLMKKLFLTPRAYRKMLSKLRAYIQIVERNMCAREWNIINYEHVPSRASMLYRKAFPKHDPVGYATWKGKAFRGEAKVNAATLYPYDITSKVMNGSWDETLELQWRNLPNYFAGKVHSGLVVCDVSGSMTSGLSSTIRPLDVAISLALYMGERMTGPFKDHFITFSANPILQKITGASLADKCRGISQADWGMNTNIQAVFDLVLNKAVQHHLHQKDLPGAIYIVSDMQFDQCGRNTNLETIKAKFEAHGYNMPLLVFWYVRSSDDKVALENEKGVVMVSGFSPSAVTAILKVEKPKEVTPYELMLKTINTERYESIVV